jgi:hypothetical protein
MKQKIEGWQGRAGKLACFVRQRLEVVVCTDLHGTAGKCWQLGNLPVFGGCLPYY